VGKKTHYRPFRGVFRVLLVDRVNILHITKLFRYINQDFWGGERYTTYTNLLSPVDKICTFAIIYFTQKRNAAHQTFFVVMHAKCKLFYYIS
jgi:hypothetical protein